VLEEVQRFAKMYGFFFPAAEIYAGTPAGFWDYGPLGTALKRRFIELLRREIFRRDGMLELDGCVILPRSVFEASGHLKSFADPTTRCERCGSYFRADKLLHEKAGLEFPEGGSLEELHALLQEKAIACPSCGGPLSKPFLVSLMFKVLIGPKGEECYLRPETCQSIFVDFLTLYKTLGFRLPQGIAQVGKSFRNEISPRQGFLRLREFYQAEMEVFFNPSKRDVPKLAPYLDDRLSLHDDRGARELSVRQLVEGGIVAHPLIAYYLALLKRFYLKAGLPEGALRFRLLRDDERAFYSRQAFDLEVRTSVGWLELVACNYRGDYDLSNHSRVSGQEIAVEEDGGSLIAHIFELSMGIDRSIYALLEHALVERQGRRVLELRPYLAPLQVAVFPLVQRERMPEKAREVKALLELDFDVLYEEEGSIGRRYRKADLLGVPFCVTVDGQTLIDDTVTVRDRDTMQQRRIAIAELPAYLRGALALI
jgi:glycyl-tRNA synthetase